MAEDNEGKKRNLDSAYTSTITDAARRRGIRIDVIDSQLPVFALSYGEKTVRCYNGLTDDVGAATFHLAHDKGAANRFLKKFGLPVPGQEVVTTFSNALAFMKLYGSIVVKPVSQWGGRGVSTHVSNAVDLRAAITFARRYCDEVVLEECVTGIDWRLIFVNYKYICAIQRDAAVVYGDGISTIRELIKKKNKQSRAVDPSNTIPIERETRRCIEAAGMTYSSIPGENERVIVRRTSNYHTGGTVDIVTDKVPAVLIEAGERVANLLGAGLLGVDMLVDISTNRFTIIEMSPDMAISPPEGGIVAEAFLDNLFPDSAINVKPPMVEMDSIEIY
jgi:D-alanine-D-alanine ligase-like ATP-grasp enzyme